jgi:hypothetical protein
MPGKRREVHSFVTRLSPELVRKLDAYAVQSNLSRNQLIEKMLGEYFGLRHEAHALREMAREQNADVGGSAADVFDRYAEDVDYQRVVAAEKLANPDFFEDAAVREAQRAGRGKRGGTKDTGKGLKRLTNAGGDVEGAEGAQ